MVIIKCKMCGRGMNIEEGQSTCKCEHCGAEQRVKEFTNEIKDLFLEYMEYITESFKVSSSNDNGDTAMDDKFFCCPTCREPLYWIDYCNETDWAEVGAEMDLEGNLAPWTFCPICGDVFDDM